MPDHTPPPGSSSGISKIKNPKDLLEMAHSRKTLDFWVPPFSRWHRHLRSLSFFLWSFFILQRSASSRRYVLSFEAPASLRWHPWRVWWVSKILTGRDTVLIKIHINLYPETILKGAKFDMTPFFSCTGSLFENRSQIFFLKRLSVF